LGRFFAPDAACAAVYYIIAPSEASANLARYDGSKYGFSYKDTDSMWEGMEKTKQFGFGPEVKRRIIAPGTYALSSGFYDAYYLKAQKVRDTDPAVSSMLLLKNTMALVGTHFPHCAFQNR